MLLCVTYYKTCSVIKFTTSKDCIELIKSQDKSKKLSHKLMEKVDNLDIV